jgi:hypothetical protein
MFVPRQQYPRELKIALMHEIDSGKSTAWVARNYPKRLEVWKSEWRAKGVVSRMLEPLMRVTEADLMQAIAYPLPMRVIAEMLGIPRTMETWLLASTEVIA